MCFFRKRRERKKALEAELAAKKEQPVQKAAVVEPKVEESKPQVVEKKVEVKEEPAKKSVPENLDEKNESKAPKIAKYHVSQNKDEGSEFYKKWRVRKEGSTKTIKFFDTQKEAITFAEGLAETAGSSVVIHKLDGSIRKQDYAKKEGS